MADSKSQFAKLLDAAEPITLTPGEVVDATVVTKSKSELWVDVGGLVTGFIPAREVAESGKAIHSINVGDTVPASVVVPENDEGYVILSMKRAARDQVWGTLEKQFADKDAFQAKVLEANAGGLLLDAGGVRGFMPVSQLAPENYPRVSGGDRDAITDKLSQFIGSNLTVAILDLKQQDNKLILSEKLARSKETEASLSKYEVGDVVKGKVTGVVDFGAFVSFDSLEGLIHISELDWNRVAEPSDIVAVGDEVEAKIISIEGSKVSLSLKRMGEDPWLKIAEQYKEGDTVKGKVSRLTPFGAFVDITDDVAGLVHVSELSEDHVEKPEDVLTVGDTKEFLILNIDPETHRIALSIKGLAAPEEALARRKSSAPAAPPADLSSLSSSVLAKLSEAGYGDMAKLKAASIEDLEQVPGIGAATAEKIKAALK